MPAQFSRTTTMALRFGNPLGVDMSAPFFSSFVVSSITEFRKVKSRLLEEA
jgi:hypothetical protein